MSLDKDISYLTDLPDGFLLVSTILLKVSLNEPYAIIGACLVKADGLETALLKFAELLVTLAVDGLFYFMLTFLGYTYWVGF